MEEDSGLGSGSLGEEDSGLGQEETRGGGQWTRTDGDEGRRIEDQ